jgi:hypothetical protein
MKCNYSLEDIDNFYERNISIESSDKITEHLKSCEDCRVYYSSLVITGKLINRDEMLKENTYNKIESRLDKNKYIGGKKLLYRISRLMHSNGHILKPAMIVVLILLISVFTIKNSVQISNFIGSSHDNITNVDQSRIYADVIKDKIITNGGIGVKLSVNGINQQNPTTEELELTKKILDKRLLNIGKTEPLINIDKSTNTLDISASWVNGQKDDGFENTLKSLVQTGQLTFQEVDQNKVDNNGLYLPTGVIICSNKDITEAHKETDPNNGKVIFVKLNEDGTRKFAEATGRLISKPIAIFLDNNLLIAPTVQTQITDGRIVINGIQESEIDSVTAIINTLPLPLKVDVSEYKVIEPEIRNN